MPYYFPLRWNFTADEAAHTAERLLRLRRQMRAEIPDRSVNDTLLLATWNLRDFDSNKFGHGPRLKESLFYIAEIISGFDLIALQEVNEDLTALQKIMRILGPEWDYIATDQTAGVSGNNERMAYVYDKRKVHFEKIAGEIVLPDSRLVGGNRQFARTPFLVAFQSGWLRFMICTVHIYYGADSGDRLARRIAEIEALVEMLSRRADDEAANYIVLGDFNIVSPEHQTMAALQRRGFTVAEALSRLPSNIQQNKHYDQIAFKPREGQLQYSGRAGVFNLYDTLFKRDDFAYYAERMGKRAELAVGPDGKPALSQANLSYYEDVWRTFQVSDHLPMWVELNINFADAYLAQFLSSSFSVPAEHPLSFSMPELE